MAGPWMTDLEESIVLDAMQHWYEGCYDYCEKFQKEFAEYHNRKYGIMTPNCTSAIHLLLLALETKEIPNWIIVPECTWIATAAPIYYCYGSSPVFCDIESHNWCLDPESVESYFTLNPHRIPLTKAIIVVDLYGNMPNMNRLLEISDRYGIPLIEDAAEAVGSSYKGNRAGSFGIGSVFSFHRTKTIVTGEGGMLLLDDDKLYDRCMFLRDHGRVKDIPYYNIEVTPKYMPFNIQAALGYAQFKRIDELVDKKRWILHKYKECLKSIDDLQFNEESEDVVNGAWCTTLVIGKSHRMNKFIMMERLQNLGLPTRPFFYPLSSLPAFEDSCDEYMEEECPVAYDISRRGINLPSALNITEEQIKVVCDGIRRILDENEKYQVGKAS